MARPTSPIPDVSERQFRIDYFWGDWFDRSTVDSADEDGPSFDVQYGDYPALGRDLEFRFAEGCSLSLGLDSGLCYMELSLSTPWGDRPEIMAWKDMAHWHPHALR